MNLASAQARHKEDAQKLEASRRESQARVTTLKRLIASKDDQTKRTEQEIQSFKKVVHNKQIEVCNLAGHISFK